MINETLLSNGEIGAALVHYAIAQGRVPRSARVLDVRVIVEGPWGGRCHGQITWEPAPQSNETTERK